MTEKQLVQTVIPLFDKEYKIFEEVKIFTRSIDVVLKKNDKLIAVEFKLNDYKKAFEQISDYQIVTDYSYLCIPKRKLSSHIFTRLQENGIGLFMYNSDDNALEEIIKPNNNSLQIEYYKNYLLKKLKKTKD